MKIYIQLFLLLLLLFIGCSCTSGYISDQLLPNSVKIVPQDYPLYDGKLIYFSVADIHHNLPTSISGREQYTWEELTDISGIVVGEYTLPNGNYYIIQLENGAYIKIPSLLFFNVVRFIDQNNN